MLDEDDYVFNNYVERTIDPGNTLFNIVLFISIASIAGVPFVVRLWRCFSMRWDKRHTDPRKRDEENSSDTTTAHIENDSEDRDKDGEGGLDPPQAQSSGSMMEKAQHEICNKETFFAEPENIKLNNRCKLVSSAREQQGTQEKAGNFSGGKIKGRPPSMSICALDYLWTIVKYDNETHRLVRLIVPFTLSSIAYTALTLIELSIISQTLGTDAMIAYVMVQTIVGISSSFFGGLVEAVTTLSSMAYGAENYKLAYHYVQVDGVLYVLCEIPMIFVWRFAIGKILLLTGFDESVAALAEENVLVEVAIDMMMGMNESLHAFLQEIERENYQTSSTSSALLSA
jgi:hypothetical protein